MKMKTKVFTAMSGGVDSSVAALLLKRRGYDIVGVFMRCYNIDGCAERDAEDARRVAEKIGIPFYVWDFEEEYKRKVVDYMVQGYRAGLTPNPDVMCNQEIKFGLFLERALRVGAPASRQAGIYVATGHHVRIKKVRIKGKKNTLILYSLFSSLDSNKDQSYFLWTLTQKQLQHCLFPIGDYLKSEVREIARKAGLPTAEKKDSQGICFLGKVGLVDFLKQYIPEKPGAVLNLAGEKIGEHRGAHFYTVGQRHLGVRYQVSGIKRGGDTKPFYIAEKDIRRNAIVVAEGADNPALYRKEIELADVNLFSPQYSQILKNVRISVLARVRYRQPLAPAQFALIGGGKAKLIFDEPQKFVAPGQSAVIYAERETHSAGRGKEYEMLGGGVIQ